MSGGGGSPPKQPSPKPIRVEAEPTETLEKKKLRTARGYRSTVLTPGLMNPQANTLKQKLGA